MTSSKISALSLRLGAMTLVSAAALGGCSTVSSMSPFSSNVPYAQDIQPTLPRPAQTEIPAFKPSPKPAPKPAPEPEPAAAPPAPPAASPAPAAPAPAAPAALPPAAAPAPAAPPAPPAPPSPPPASQSAAPEAAPAPKVAEAAPAPAATQPAGDADADQPQIPAEHRQFKDDGTYPNLAQVPSRPVNLPTFADAKKIEKSLEADDATSKTASPESPSAPSVDSAPGKSASAAAAKPAAAPVAGQVASRGEDKAPCLGAEAAPGSPDATVHFAPGSAALTSADLQGLAEAMPTVRGAKGTIRVFGHGDTDANAQQSIGRFDLAAARAGAVAQALAGFGIPVAKIAVGVACRDAATSGASVQLYAES